MCIVEQLGNFKISTGCWRSQIFACVLVAQLCPTLCNAMDCSPPGSSVHGILQARILGWVAISSPGDLPDPGIKPRCAALQVDSLPSEPPGKSYIFLCSAPNPVPIRCLPFCCCYLFCCVVFCYFTSMKEGFQIVQQTDGDNDKSSDRACLSPTGSTPIILLTVNFLSTDQALRSEGGFLGHICWEEAVCMSDAEYNRNLR